MPNYDKQVRRGCADCKLFDGVKCCLYTECNSQNAISIDAIDNAIEKFQRAANTRDALEMRWISALDRLPIVEDNVIVTVCDVSGDIAYRYTTVGWYTGFGNKWIVENEFCQCVTHWMPLPKPPK